MTHSPVSEDPMRQQASEPFAAREPPLEASVQDGTAQVMQREGSEVTDVATDGTRVV